MSCRRRDRVVRVLKLPTAPDDYAFMLSEDYAAAVQHQEMLMQVVLAHLALILQAMMASPMHSGCGYAYHD